MRKDAVAVEFVPITGIIIGILVIAIVEIALFRASRRPERGAGQVGGVDERSGDGERIVVYANRGPLLRRAYILIAFSGFAVVGFLSLLVVLFAPQLLSQDMPGQSIPYIKLLSWLIFAGIAAFGAIPMTALTFIRLMRRSPTLIVNADGIVDRCSSIASGRGLLRWKEIAWVGYEIRPGAGNIQMRLVINLFQSPTASASKPWTEIPSPTASYPFTTTVLRMDEELLDMPVGELVYQIERYIKLHVPPGWHGALSEERGDAGQIIDPPVSIHRGW